MSDTVIIIIRGYGSGLPEGQHRWESEMCTARVSPDMFFTRLLMSVYSLFDAIVSSLCKIFPHHGMHVVFMHGRPGTTVACSCRSTQVF